MKGWIYGAVVFGLAGSALAQSPPLAVGSDGPTIIGIMWARGVADGGQPNTYGAGPINSAAVAVR